MKEGRKHQESYFGNFWLSGIHAHPLTAYLFPFEIFTANPQYVQWLNGRIRQLHIDRDSYRDVIETGKNVVKN